MKIDFTQKLTALNGQPIVMNEGGEPVTLGEALNQALMTDPVYEGGHSAGTPRPLSAAEVAQSIKLTGIIAGGQDASTDDIVIMKSIATRLRAVLSLPICMALENAASPAR